MTPDPTAAAQLKMPEMPIPPIPSTIVDKEEQKKLKAQLGTGFVKNPEKFIINQSGVTSRLDEPDLQPTDTVYFKNNSDSEYHIDATSTKVFVEGCRNIKLHLNDRVITHTLEVWKCENIEIHCKTKVQTVQVDMCSGASVIFSTTDDFNRLVWSASEDLSLSFTDAPEHRLETGSKRVAKVNSKVNPETDQFIVRLLPHKATGQVQLLNELVVRLDNGFPTTEREARQFEERQEANLKALAKEMLGKDIVLGKKKGAPSKVGRNDSCICGSGKKYKKCCGTDAF